MPAGEQNKKTTEGEGGRVGGRGQICGRDKPTSLLRKTPVANPLGGRVGGRGQVCGRDKPTSLLRKTPVANPLGGREGGRGQVANPLGRRKCTSKTPIHFWGGRNHKLAPH